MSFHSDYSLSNSSTSRSNTPSSASDFQPTKNFLLSPTLLDIEFLRKISKKLDKGSGDRIVISINHSDASTNGWVQEAITTLPCVDVEGKRWEKHLVDGIAQV
jgi:hypothetical protein